jgi:hypothetical protein
MTQLTIEKAKHLKHGQTLYTPGYYNADGTVQRWRVNGQPKTWKTQPNRVQVPIKRGMYEFWYVDETNYQRFTLTEPAHQNKKDQANDRDFARAMRNPDVIAAMHGFKK